MHVQVADAVAQHINRLLRVVRSQQLHEHEWALGARRRVDWAEHIAHRPVREHLPHIPQLDVVRDVGDAHGRCGRGCYAWARLPVYSAPDWPHPLLGVEPRLECGLALLRGGLPAAPGEPVLEGRAEVRVDQCGGVRGGNLFRTSLGLQLGGGLLCSELILPLWVELVHGLAPVCILTRAPPTVEVIHQPARLGLAGAEDLLEGVGLRGEPLEELWSLKPTDDRSAGLLRLGRPRVEEMLPCVVAPLHVRTELAAGAPLRRRAALVLQSLVVVADVLILLGLLVQPLLEGAAVGERKVDARIRCYDGDQSRREFDALLTGNAANTVGDECLHGPEGGDPC